MVLQIFLETMMTTMTPETCTRARCVARRNGTLADVSLLMCETCGFGTSQNNKLEVFLAQMAQQLKTQDNAITLEPIFVVEQKQRDYGYDPEYAEQTGYHDKEDPEKPVFTDVEYQAHLAIGGEELEEIGWKDRWEFVQPFLTRLGAESYIQANQHNLRETRIFVHSAFRNFEWQAIREMLLTQEGWIACAFRMPVIGLDVLFTDGKKSYLGELTEPIPEELPTWWSGEWTIKGVTHWRFLPELPK